MKRTCSASTLLTVLSGMLLAACGDESVAVTLPTEGAHLRGQFGMFAAVDAPADSVFAIRQAPDYERITVSQSKGTNDDEAFFAVNLAHSMVGRSRVPGTYYMSNDTASGDVPDPAAIEALLGRSANHDVRLEPFSQVQTVDPGEVSVWLCGRENGEMQDAVSSELVFQVRPGSEGTVEVHFVARGDTRLESDDGQVTFREDVGSGSFRLPAGPLEGLGTEQTREDEVFASPGPESPDEG